MTLRNQVFVQVEVERYRQLALAGHHRPRAGHPLHHDVVYPDLDPGDGKPFAVLEPLHVRPEMLANAPREPR